MIRRNSGQSLIEVCVGIVVLVPVCLLLLDFAILLNGMQANDSMCRSAARAAAAGKPSEAENRVRVILDRANSQSSGELVSSFSLCEPVAVKVSRQPATEFDPIREQNVNPGGPIEGTATVSTTVDVRPFFFHKLCGKPLPIKLRSTHTFPISYVVPPSYLLDNSVSADNARGNAGSIGSN